VADESNNTIRKVTPSGLVSTLAGTTGQAGSNDGTGTAARFNDPTGIAVDSQDNLFVTDYYNNAIRKITPAGVVTTLTGKASQEGYVNGSLATARFSFPTSIAVDADDNLYVSDSNVVRKISTSGYVSTVVGVRDSAHIVTLGGLPAHLNRPAELAIVCKKSTLQTKMPF